MANLNIGVPLENLFQPTYESGSAVIIRNTRYDWRSDLGGASAGVYTFFDKQMGSNHANGFVRTNMRQASIIENGRAFEVQQIALKVVNRGVADTTAGTAVNDNTWFNRVIRTLFLYGSLRFFINGTDHTGEFPLSLFLPVVSNQGSDEYTTGGNTNQVVIDLKDKVIPLTSMVNFNVQLHLNVPQVAWAGAGQNPEWTALPTGDTRGFVPVATEVMLGLIGKELYSQR